MSTTELQLTQNYYPLFLHAARATLPSSVLPSSLEPEAICQSVMQIGYGLTDAQKGGEQHSTQLQQHKNHKNQVLAETALHNKPCTVY